MFFPVHDVEWREEPPSFISVVSSSVISALSNGGERKSQVRMCEVGLDYDVLEGAKIQIKAKSG
jgi:hypothetical protein